MAQAGATREFTWCALCGKLVGLEEPLDNTYAWDLDGDHDTVKYTDARGGETIYRYGPARELKEIEYPDGGIYYFEYNEYGDIRRMKRPQSTAWINLTYDAAGRFRTMYQSTTTFQDRNYNADNTISSAANSSSTLSYTYTGDRQVASENFDFTPSPLSLTKNQVVEYTYNTDGSISQMRWKNGTATVATWEYGYDGAGRVTAVTNSFGETTTYTYDNEGKIVSQSNQNGTSVEYEYNQPRAWPTEIRHKAGTTSFEVFEIEYDQGTPSVGNITKVDELNGDEIEYDYDALYRLLSEVKTGSVDPYTRSYGYDPAGNVIDYNGRRFTANNLANMILSITNGAATYDNNGNLTEVYATGIDLSQYTYNIMDQLMQQKAGSPYLNYRYDARGRRIYSAYGSINKRYYVFSGDRLIGELTNTSGGTAAVAYTWGPDGLISKRDLTGTPQSYWYHFGLQGETRYMTNSSGATVRTYKYTVYGLTRSSTGSVTNPYRYGGKYGYYNHDHTGIMLAGARWYHPGLFRWLTRDPIGYEGGFNLYQYVGGRVVNYVDPLGTDAVKTLSDFSAGFGDTISFGLTEVARDYLGEQLFGPNVGGLVDYDSGAYEGGEAAGVLWGCLVGRSAALGQELRIGKNFRVAPFGNRTGHKYGKYPHYHRRGGLSPRTGTPDPGQGIGRHRPWEPSRHDKDLISRF